MRTAPTVVTMIGLIMVVMSSGSAGPTSARENASGGSVLEPGAKLQKLADNFKFTEGPASDAGGNVYFTDQPNDRILVWSTNADGTGQLSTFLQPCGRSNGLCFDRDGRHLLACADENNELWSIDVKTKQHAVLLRDYEGKRFNGPNDLWVAPDGSVYFTDPYYKRDYWKRGPSEQGQHVYRLGPDRKSVVRVIDDLKQPNGIVGTPDGKTLYVADIGAKRTYAYDIAGPDGKLTNKRLFCEMGSDGVTLDDAGNLYLTGNGVTVFDKAGNKIEQIPVPEGWTANVCFGGKDRRTLFITASKGLYAIRTRTAGAGSQ